MSTEPQQITRKIGVNGHLKLQWRPSRDDDGPSILVMQGDLTTCNTGGIVNAANSRLAHGGGVAKAIVRSGGFIIQKKSDDWIRKHKALAVGCAMSTTAGSLPCRRVIHTVGPMIKRNTLPTDEEAGLLRMAVRNALEEAARLGLSSLAIPGISTGSFGYPLDLGAAEIVSECVRFCREAAVNTSLKVIVLLNIDDRTVAGFVDALREAAKQDGMTLDCLGDHVDTMQTRTKEDTRTVANDQVREPLGVNGVHSSIKITGIASVLGAALDLHQ